MTPFFYYIHIDTKYIHIKLCPSIRDINIHAFDLYTIEASTKTVDDMQPVSCTAHTLQSLQMSSKLFRHFVIRTFLNTQIDEKFTSTLSRSTLYSGYVQDATKKWTGNKAHCDGLQNSAHPFPLSQSCARLGVSINLS